ncbi:GPI mannosyltransferase 4-like [Actinia tenebrosa]|uniref:Mannosyltransferase n=1 Tax=Actinia tenebrosa TaxID=6105 RepID=A0A6P8IBH5_ACTTE|nr:GPI mannosyltransferase 4-like [Actinia tenebrosa]
MADKVLFWLALLFIRFLWVISPQSGYIHPDEYFQSPEITAGDVFGFQTLRTWEFNETFPIRSILFPHLTTGIPFIILKKLHSAYNGSPWILNTWSLALLPRVVYCSISLLIDLSAYKISQSININPAPVLFAIGTSYVTLVFHTRPFSNSLESVLFSLLLWLLTSHIFSSKNASHQTWGSTIRNFGIGILVTAGVWNRPTFLAFAVFPGLSWAYSFYTDSDTMKTFITQLIRPTFTVAVGAVITALLFISVDSIYYGYFSTNEGQLAVTPLNFIKYNLDTSKIKEHGLHPRFTHFLVNMPLLYGILALLFFLFLVVLIFKRDYLGCLWEFFVISAEDVQELTNNKIKQKKPLHQKIMTLKVMMLSVVVPVTLLSIIPHQEPRFLTPILLPLAILFGHLISGTKHLSFVKTSWLMWNILGCIVFGILHQGGMYSSLGYLQKHLAALDTNSSELTSVHLVFSNTYMPPRYLLAWPRCVPGSKYCQSFDKHLYVHDLGGKSNDELVKWLDQLVESEKKKMGKYTFEVFVICPSTLHFHHPLFPKEAQFFPHLSMENPPDFGTLLHFINSRASCKMKPGNRYADDEHYCTKMNQESIVTSLLKWTSFEFSLNLYKCKTINSYHSYNIKRSIKM